MTQDMFRFPVGVSQIRFNQLSQNSTSILPKSLYKASTLGNLRETI